MPSLMPGLYEKRGWFYYRPPTKAGEPRSKPIALRTKDVAQAVPRAKELRDMAELNTALIGGTLAEVLPRYYAAKKEDSKDTKRNRIRVMDGFKDILGNPKLADIDADLLAEWSAYVDKKGSNLKGKGPASAAAKKGYWLIVKAFFNWAKAEGLIHKSPVDRIGRGKTAVKITKVHDFLTEEEREILLAAEAPDYVKLILHLGFFAGLREMEMLCLNPAWIWISPDGSKGKIDVQDTKITFVGGATGYWRPKGRRARSIPMHPRLLAFIQEYKIREPYLIAPHKTEWPPETKTSTRFSAHKAMEFLLKRVKGVRKLNFHILRHSFATHLVMKDVPLRTVAAYLGDRLSVVEDHYAGFSPSRDNPLAML